MYYYAGGRQNASLLVTAEGESRLFVRRSLARAQHESGGDDSPHSVESFPRMAAFAEEIGCKPAMQFGELPHSFATRFASKVGVTEDCTQIVHMQREVKSSWELKMMAEGAEIQMAMFEAVSAVGGEGVPEIELVAAAEAVSRAAGFGGNVQMRRFPLQCDRGVIVSGRRYSFILRFSNRRHWSSSNGFDGKRIYKNQSERTGSGRPSSPTPRIRCRHDPHVRCGVIILRVARAFRRHDCSERRSC